MKIGKFKISKTWLAAIIIVILIFGYYGVKIFFKNPLEGYQTETIDRGAVEQEVSETGSVRATKEVSLGFKSIGKISAINVNIGDNVAKGQILAALDSGDIAAQLQSAKAVLLAAQIQYEKLLNGSTQEDVKTYQDSVDSAKHDLQSVYDSSFSALDDAYSKIYNAYKTVVEIQKDYFPNNDQPSIKVVDAKKDIDSNMQSFKKYVDQAEQNKLQDDIDSAISQAISALNSVYADLEIIRDQCDQGNYYLTILGTDKSLLDAQKEYVNTVLTSSVSLQKSITAYKIALQKANDNLSVITASPRSEDVEIYKSQIAQAQANVDLYQSQLGDNYVYSPIDGKVTTVNAKKGETVTYAESIINLLSTEPFQIKVDVYEQDIVNVGVGNSVKINLVAFPKQTFDGKVLSIDPAEKIVDNVVYYEVTIEFPNQPEGIRSGMTADITIETNSKENVLRISKNAIESIDGKEIVEVFKNGKIEKREVQIGLEGDDYYEVLSGLSEGDLVIIGKE